MKAAAMCGGRIICERLCAMARPEAGGECPTLLDVMLAAEEQGVDVFEVLSPRNAPALA